MKMDKKLSKEDVAHLAKLSALEVSDEEVSQYQEQLGETLQYVENLQKLDTSKVDPLHHVTNLENVGAEDGIENSRGLTQEEVLSNSQGHKNGLFVVKRLIG